MPAFLAPHKSGAHRVTAIALYRALLTKCRNAPQPLNSATLVAVVKNKFRGNRHVTSINALRTAFAGGYEKKEEEVFADKRTPKALDHLDKATAGDKSKIGHLKALVSRLPRWVKAIPPKRIRSPAPSPQQSPAPTPPPLHLKSPLDLRPRPLFSLPTRRRIPTLVSANKIPILRLTKPQPASLSKYLKSRIVDRQKRLDRKVSLEAAMQVAKGEDEWDRLLLQQGVAEQGVMDEGERAAGKGVGHGRGKREELWTKSVYEALGHVYGKIEEEGRRNKEMAGKMVGIIEREKEMAEIERKERQRVKNEERRRRKDERGGMDDVKDKK
ncbi:hypothetical protein E4T39_07718 [Aureobasidium subglaciale]|nr:hypothetical protein E4T39_07718 [Aureobasidium subglaciale]